MRFRLPLCFLDRHAPRRNHAKWDGRHYVGTCKLCRTRIRRRDDGRWAKDWLEEG